MAPRPLIRRRALTIALLLAGLATLAIAGPASADLLTPESGGSPNADEIDSLYKLILYVAIVVFVGVEGALIYSLVRFSAKRNPVPSRIHGNTSLEIGWTVGAALILVVLTVVTFIKLDDIKDPQATGPNGLATASSALVASTDKPKIPGGKGLEIKVDGRQFVWRFTYPNGAFAYEEMVVPVDTSVILQIEATDVVHSWWVPKMGGKMDAVPGHTNWTWFKATKPGVYDGWCAELCGRGHANMRARVRVVETTEYQAWVEKQKADIGAANKAAVEQREALGSTP